MRVGIAGPTDRAALMALMALIMRLVRMCVVLHPRAPNHGVEA